MNMKPKLFLLLFLVTSICSCRKFDDSHLWDSINSLNGRVERLEDVCDRMNTNISSLQVIVQALENNDAVTNVSSLPNGMGYTITFLSGKIITIYNGTDGKDGDNGKDGQNGVDGQDGRTPVISVRKDVDGIYYWTVDGEWLVVDGQKVKAVGTDGKDGEDGMDGQDGEDGHDGTDGKPGIDGTDGRDGITPQFKIEDGYWYISYDNRQSWEQVGKATGDNGLNGTDGESFFKGVSIENGYVCFILNDEDATTINLPFVSGESALTIQLETAGTLEKHITDEQEKNTTILKVVGEINEDDMMYINLRLTALKELDLSETNYTYTIHDTDFCLNPWSEWLPNKTLQRITTPKNIKNRTNYDINVEYCFALKTVSVTSTQKVSFIQAGKYMLNQTKEILHYQIDSLILPWGMTESPYYMNSAANIVFPETITKVNLGTRNGDQHTIKTITCKAIVPPSTGTSSMDGVSEDAILYVPPQSVDLYKVADDWKTIKTILPIEE